MLRKLGGLAVLSLAFVGSTAHADLLGDSFEATFYANDPMFGASTGSLGTETVTSTAAMFDGFGDFNLSVSRTQINIVFAGGAEFVSTADIILVDKTKSFQGTFAATSSSVTGLIGEQTADNTFVLHVGGLFPASDQAAAFTLVPAVPEPETYAMLMAGLGLIGFAASRRARKIKSPACVPGSWCSAGREPS